MTFDPQIVEACRNERALLNGISQMRRTAGPNELMTQMLSTLSSEEMRDLCLLMAGQLSQTIREVLAPSLNTSEQAVIDHLTEAGFIS